MRARWRCGLPSKKIDLPPGVLEPREAVLNMAPYSPPTAGRADKLRLDFNENTVGASPKVIEYLREHLNAADLAVYPEYGQVKRELGAFFGVELLVLAPSYAMYRFYAELAGAAVRAIPYRADRLAFPLDELLSAIRPATRAVLIANPNNPT